MSWVNCAVAQQVGPAVAHLADEISPRQQHEHGRGRAHAALVVLGERALEDRVVGRPDRLRGSARPPRVARTSRGASRSRATMMRTAISLATSPAACPPIPSATMNTPRSESIR